MLHVAVLFDAIIATLVCSRVFPTFIGVVFSVLASFPSVIDPSSPLFCAFFYPNLSCSDFCVMKCCDGVLSILLLILSSTFMNLSLSLFRKLDLASQFLQLQQRKPEPKEPLTARFLDKYSWNEHFQLLLERPITTAEEAVDRCEKISLLSKKLAHEAIPIVENLVEQREMSPDNKKYKINTCGFAGGEKYNKDQMFLKFATHKVTVKRQDGTTTPLYNDYAHAAKVAGHELKGVSAILSCNIPNLHVPLMCAITLKGYRAVAMTMLPIDDQTLVFGSDNAAGTIHEKHFEEYDVCKWK